MVVTLSKDEKKAYGIFSWLRNRLPDADISTLRHISVYLAKTNDEFDVEKDLELLIFNNGMMYRLCLKDGTEIRFSNNSNESIYLAIEKNDEDIGMTLLFSFDEAKDISKTIVFGSIIYEGWNYVVGLDDFERNICFIKVYKDGKLFEDGTSYFKVSIDSEISLDCIDGLGYLTDIIIRVELLYDNLRSIKNNRLVRKKCV